MKVSLAIILIFLIAASALGFIIQLITWKIEKKDD
jgi:predicted permease